MSAPRRYWTREWILDACHEWVAIYGTPPRSDNWQRSPDPNRYPCSQTVKTKFGSWNKMLEAAGLPTLTAQTASLLWTRERIIAALHEFAAEHGRAPFAKEWRVASPRYPNAQTVERRFGSWNAGLEAAGLETRPAYAVPRWTKDEIANAMLDELVRTGRWPRLRDWQKVSDDKRPTATTVIRAFGTWTAAKRYAGWDERQSSRPIERGCKGCGADLESRTMGCRHCSDRHRNRLRYRTNEEYRLRANRLRRQSLAAARRVAAVEPGLTLAAPARGGTPVTTPSSGEAMESAVKEAA